MMKCFTFLLLSWLLPVLSWAQSVVISGQVQDTQTNDPLAGANILVVGTNQGTVTDIEGHYSLSVSSSADIILKASYVGYQSQEVSISTGDNQSITQDFTLKPTQSLEEVVIQAIRADQKDPVSQVTVEREEIEELYIGQDALYVLEETTPSILTYSESGTKVTNYGQMRLRGIDQTRINITLNGVPLNDMIDQGVFFSNFTDFGNSVESVQVQRGVGTSTNGTASYAGSINFESVNLQDSDPSAEFQLGGGSFNTFRGSGEVKTGLINDKFAFYSRFTKTYSDGYRYHSGTNSHSFFFSGGYFGEKDLVKITGFTGRTQNDLAYLPVALPDIQQDPRTNYVSENDIDDFGQHLLQLQYTRIFNDNTSIASTLYYGGAGGDFPAGFPDENGNFMQINYPLYNNHYGFMSYLNHSTWQERLNINGGVHAYSFQRKNVESVIPNYTEPYYEDKSRKNELSIFGKASYEWHNFLLFGDLQVRTVQLDLMPDHSFLGQSAEIPTRKWTFVNPKVGITYEFNSTLNVYASYGRSGREPTRFDILGSTQINTFNLTSVQDIQAIQPEYVNDVEAGIRLSQEKLSGQMNLFYMQFENEIAPIGISIPEGFVQLRKNVPSSYRRGIETSWYYQPVEQWSFAGNLTYMQSQIREYAPEGSDQVYHDVQPIISPEWIVNADVAYQGNDWQIAVSPRYVSQSYLEPTNQADLILPSFFIVDVRASVALMQNLSLSMYLNNIFDEQYYSYGQPVSYHEKTVPGYFVQPPRNFYLMLRLKF